MQHGTTVLGTRTIDARIIEISQEGEVAPELALVRVNIEGINVSVRDSIVLPPGRAKALLNSLGLSNCYEAKGAIVNADYRGGKLERLYVRASPERQ
ncbi:hypothetical protein HYU20_03860 [Candidatus Woesearchaeota archaeon]|nr:hypothetical protein [Candidatus Woesearchaeota archaeon]